MYIGKKGGQSYLVFEYVILIKLIDFTKAYEALNCTCGLYADNCEEDTTLPAKFENR